MRRGASVLLLVACACADPRIAAMGAWKGHAVDDLFAAWGPPTTYHDAHDAGKLAVYQWSVVEAQPGFDPGADAGTCTATFSVDRDGIVRGGGYTGTQLGCRSLFDAKAEAVPGEVAPVGAAP